MKTFQRYLSSINKGSTVEVLDLPVAVLDHLLAKSETKSVSRRIEIFRNGETARVSRNGSKAFTGAFPEHAPGLFEL